MPFHATFKLPLDNTGATFAIPQVYWRVDYDNIKGGETEGWSGVVRGYSDIGIADADLGNDIGQYCQSARIPVTAANVPGSDPRTLLDAAAVKLFDDAVSAPDTPSSIAILQQESATAQQQAQQAQQAQIITP